MVQTITVITGIITDVTMAIGHMAIGYMAMSSGIVFMVASLIITVVIDRVIVTTAILLAIMAMYERECESITIAIGMEAVTMAIEVTAVVIMVVRVSARHMVQDTDRSTMAISATGIKAPTMPAGIRDTAYDADAILRHCQQHGYGNRPFPPNVIVKVQLRT